MCPMCMTTAMIAAAGTASGAGVVGVLALKLRRLRPGRSRRKPGCENRSVRDDDAHSASERERFPV